VPKGKKIKVLTHRPRYIETTIVPEFGEGTSSIAEAKQAAPAARSAKGSIVVPKVPIVGPAKAKDDAARELELKKNSDDAKNSEPTGRGRITKGDKGSCHNSQEKENDQRTRHYHKTTKTLTPAPAKKVVEAATAEAEAEAVPSESVEMKPATTEEGAKQEIAEGAKCPGPEALSENLDFIICHASGKRLSEGEIAEANHYAQKLKYPKGALVFNGTDEDDFLYCLSDNKEIFVCGEMAKSMGFPKLEVGLSAMSKDDLADNLAYNNLKV
jgi:hypothetical protein